MSFQVDTKEEERLGKGSLDGKATSPKKGNKKKKEKAFKKREQVYLDYPLDQSLSDELMECEHFLFKVVKDCPYRLVEEYNVDR